MANENIGDIACPFCQSAANVRRYNARKPPKEGEGEQRGKFYVHCGECGPILASSKRVQEYILEKGKFYGAEKPKDVTPAAATVPAQKGAASSGAQVPSNAAAASAGKKRSVTFFDPYE